MSRLETAAVDLAERGYWVFPCRARDKTPVGGKGFRDATRSEKQILRWWDSTPDANVGVACAATGIAALDIDSKHGADPREVLGDLDVGSAPVILTGEAPAPCEKYPNSLVGVRGAHVLFRGKLPTTDKLTIPGCEIRGTGAYIVVPPSVHPSGVPYEGDTPPVVKIPEIPAWLPELVVTGGGDGNGSADPIPDAIGRDRNIALTSMAGTMRRRGADATEILAALLVMNEQRCKPPLHAGEVQTIARSVARYEPAPSGVAPNRGGELRRRPLHLERFEPVRFLVPDRVPLQAVTLVVGDPGLGKSTWTCGVAAAASRGVFGEATTVAMINAEDSLRNVIGPRVHAAGGDLERVEGLTIDTGEYEQVITLPDDVERLEGFVMETGARLVIIDPLMAFLTDKADANRDHSIRRALANLAMMAERHEVAVIVAAHLNKDEQKSLLYRVGGSVGLVGAARSILLFAADPDDADGPTGKLRLLAHAKSNWGTRAGTLRYRQDVVSFMSDNDEVISTVRLVEFGASELAAEDLVGRRKHETKLELVKAAILEALEDGPRPSREVKKAVREEVECGHDTLERAAKQLRDEGDLVASGSGPKTVWAAAAQPPDREPPDSLLGNQEEVQNPATMGFSKLPPDRGDKDQEVSQDVPTNLLGEDPGWRDRFVRDHQARP